MIIFLEDEELLDIIQKYNITEKHSINVVDENKLLSALNSPRQHSYYENENNIVKLAVLYAYHIAKAHGLNDGNKKIASECVLMFLEKNGYRIKDNEPNFKKKIKKFIKRIAGFDSIKNNDTYIINIAYDTLYGISERQS